MKSELPQKRPSLATRLLRVVFGFYIVVVICSMIGQMVVEYQYQKNSISRELLNIQVTFEHVLAGEIWSLDEQALRSTVEGMLRLPVIVGIKISNENGTPIAKGGIVKSGNFTEETGIYVNLRGEAPAAAKVHSRETYWLEMFANDFPITYTVNHEPRVLGQATIYSNTSVIITRVKASVLMLVVNAILQIGLLWLIFNLVFVRMLKKPLAELTNAVESVTLDNLNSIKVSVRSGCRDELGVLAESFNQMLLDLQSEIAKRKIADESLRLSEGKLNSILRVAPAGIGLIKGRVFNTVNPAMCDMTGYSSAELLGQRTQLLYPTKEEFIRAGERLYALIVQHGIGIIEVAWRRKDGRCVEVLLSAASLIPNDPDGDITFIAMDITERKRAEAEREKLQSQLTQAQKMESVGRLAGGVAHDFNNMLQSILGNTALALQDLPPESPVQENLEEIQKSAERSADLTRQLLAFARKQTIQPKVLDLNDTVEGMLKMLRRLIGEDVHLAWLPGADLWRIKMDPSQIDQILANLCVNARDAIADTGKITIETSNVVLDDTYTQSHPDCLAGDYVLLVVSDTGHGMDTDTRAHLFEPFFTTKGVGKGTGLGLATVFGIVKQNHGLINVYSEPGRGTTFKIYLPRTEAKTVAAAEEVQQRPLRGSETVLLVEDEEQILNLGRRILQRLGYTVLAAPTPAAALALAEQQAGLIHLLVTDLVMPGMNGKELAERLQANHPDLKCLFMSGYTADVIAHHGVLQAGVAFLQKPFTVQTLAVKVREVLEAHREPPRQP